MVLKLKGCSRGTYVCVVCHPKTSQSHLAALGWNFSCAYSHARAAGQGWPRPHRLAQQLHRVLFSVPWLPATLQLDLSSEMDLCAAAEPSNSLFGECQGIALDTMPFLKLY